MILSEVKYDSNGRYELHYVCHSCGRAIPNNRFEYCPHCGVKFVKSGRPEKLELDEGDICGLIAIAITNGGFNESGRHYMNDGKHYEVEGPGGMGMLWAAWKKETQEKTWKEREAKAKEKGGAE